MRSVLQDTELAQQEMGFIIEQGDTGKLDKLELKLSSIRKQKFFSFDLDLNHAEQYNNLWLYEDKIGMQQYYFTEHLVGLSFMKYFQIMRPSMQNFISVL